MTKYVMHVSFIFRIVKSVPLKEVITDLMNMNRRMEVMRDFFKELDFKNIELYGGLAMRYQFGVGVTENKTLILRRRHFSEVDNRIIPVNLYCFSAVYSPQKKKLEELAKEMEKRKKELLKKYVLIKDFYIFPEIRESAKVKIYRWDQEAIRKWIESSRGVI